MTALGPRKLRGHSTHIHPSLTTHHPSNYLPRSPCRPPPSYPSPVKSPYLLPDKWFESWLKSVSKCQSRSQGLEAAGLAYCRSLGFRLESRGYPDFPDFKAFKIRARAAKSVYFFFVFANSLNESTVSVGVSG